MRVVRRVVIALGVVAAMCVLGGPAFGDGEPLTPGGNDCAKGCVDCQKDCHEPRCMNACTLQWSGCCMTAGMKPPTLGTCACLARP